MLKSENHIPKGYKQTEIGVIPEAWEIWSMADLFSFSGGYSVSREELGNEGFCYLHYGDIHLSPNSFVDLDKQYGEIPKLDIALSEIPKSALLGDGDVVFVDASEDEDGASRHHVIFNPKNAPFISGLHTIIAKQKSDDLSNGYKRHCFQTKSVRDQFLFYVVGTKVSGISKANIKKILIPTPPLPEQEAIAEALSDVDDLIESLGQLIAKKHQIKQGAMQELLTGRKRLPSFTDEWTLKRIGEFTDCVAGGTPSTKIPGYWGGDIRWMNSGELNLRSVHDVEGRITNEGLRNSNTRMLPIGCVLIGLAGQGKTRGTVAMNLVPLCTNQSIAAILPNPAFVPRYLYYNLDLRYDELRELSAGDGGRGGLNLTILRNINLPFPTIQEQTAIASFLADMDAEINSLETKLHKARQIKQGMMQELLTGRIRLIKPESNVVQFPAKEKAETTSNKGHNWAINEAVVISVLAKKFGSDQYPLGRKRYTKLSYLFHRHAEGQVEGYLEKAAGPYNPSTKYKGAEKIALTNKYVRTHARDNFSGFVAAEKIAEAEGYFSKWYGDNAIAWLEQFRYKKNDELELLATVDMAMVNLRKDGKQVDSVSVKQYIYDAPEWKAKLDRSIFSDDNINMAMEWTEQLFKPEGEKG